MRPIRNPASHKIMQNISNSSFSINSPNMFSCLVIDNVSFVDSDNDLSCQTDIVDCSISQPVNKCASVNTIEFSNLNVIKICEEYSVKSETCHHDRSNLHDLHV